MGSAVNGGSITMNTDDQQNANMQLYDLNDYTYTSKELPGFPSVASSSPLFGGEDRVPQLGRPRVDWTVGDI